MRSPQPRGPAAAAGARSSAALASLAAAAVLVASMVLPAAASAVIVSLKSGATLSYQPAPGSRAHASVSVRAHRFDQFFKNLDYNGGPVMTSNTNYPVFWRPPGAPAYPSGYQSGLKQFFEDLAKDSGGSENVDSVATQYNDSSGAFANYDSHFGAALVDEHPYPANGCTRAPKCLTDEQVRAELVRFVKEQKLPTDLSHEYFLLTPEGIESCFEEAGIECSANVTQEEFALYCAYHGNVPLPGGGELIYSNDPFVNEKNCDPKPINHPNGSSDSALIGGLSHEHVESLTDPEPNNAWTDFATGLETGFEIGDKCASKYGPFKEKGGVKYNQVINGHFYWYQQEWSNKGHACLQHLAFKASEAPSATFTSEEGLSSEVKFNAAGSTAGAGVRYDWQFNDRPEPEALETESLTTSHFFPQFGAYTVALTVFNGEGTSYGTARTIAVRRRQLITFSSSPPSAATVGGPSYAVAATASSGLPVALTIDPASSSICSISGATVSFAGVGVCTIDANQAGTAEFAPAPLAQQSLSVGQAQPPPAPGSAFLPLGAKVNPKTGAITFTESVWNPGAFSWLLTFQNGKFGAFASSARCRSGLIKLKSKCRPRRIVFARGSRIVPTRGVVRFTVKPTASGVRALKNAFKHKRGVPLSVTLTFQASPNGIPVSQVQSITVRLKK